MDCVCACVCVCDQNRVNLLKKRRCIELQCECVQLTLNLDPVLGYALFGLLLMDKLSSKSFKSKNTKTDNDSN